MKKLVTLIASMAVCWLLLSTSVCLAENDPAGDAGIQASAMEGMSATPLAFTKNMGQWPDSILYRANSSGATMWFTSSGVIYQFTRRVPREDETGSTSDATLRHPEPVEGSKGGLDTPDSVETMLIKATFVGANPNPEVVAEGLMDYKCNYFLGNDPAKWRTDVPNYGAVILKDIYPGIDVRYASDEAHRATYELVAPPGASVEQVKVTYEGGGATVSDPDGGLMVLAKAGEALGLADATVGAARSGLCLELAYSTYLGGSGGEAGYGIAVDGAGSAYVTGATSSADFPTSTPFDSIWDGTSDDVFVTKLSPNGSSLIYSTFLGGSYDDYGFGIVVDGLGNAYVSGPTFSPDYPTITPFDGILSGTTDAFVTKLSAGGNSLVYSTYLGGSDRDYGHGIAVDTTGSTYVTGETFSDDFPMASAFDDGFNGYIDAFVAKLNPAGNSLVYSTYLGGSAYDQGRGVVVDGMGCAYVAGGTESANFPTANPLDASLNGTTDAWVTRLNSDGRSLIYSTYLGGSGGEIARGIAVDEVSNVYVTGQTNSADFPTSAPFDSSLNDSYDAFVTKLSPVGDSLVYSTYLGGGALERGYAVAVDWAGSACVTGQTYSADFPAEAPFDSTLNGTYDAFVTRLSPAGNGLVYSTYLGGSGDGHTAAIAVDGSGGVYVTGTTASDDFPIANPYDSSLGGTHDAFVTKLIAPDDTDEDGICDHNDNCPDVFNPDQTDADGDGFGAACDSNDNDSTIYPGAPELCDGQINDCNSSVLPANESDDDGDHYVECTIDAGGWDGIPTVIGGDDCNDANPDIHPATVWYYDADGDGWGEHGDSVIQCLQPIHYALQVPDNCLLAYNPGQENNDIDLWGDACDADDDNDGIPDTLDNCQFVYNPLQEDQDDDGVGNVCDNCPTVANYSQVDSDTDYVGNICDRCQGFPDSIDADGDTWPDSCDLCPATASLDNGDNDGNGTGNVCCCACPTLGNIDGSADCLVTMGDLTVLIDNLFITLTPLACPQEGNLDLSPDFLVGMGDLTVLIDHLFITLAPLPPCP